MAVLVHTKYPLEPKNALTFDVGQLGSLLVCHPHDRAAKKCSKGSKTKPRSVVGREVRSEVSPMGPNSDIGLRCPNTKQFGLGRAAHSDAYRLDSSIETE